jgi:hypothetical protein
MAVPELPRRVAGETAPAALGKTTLGHELHQSPRVEEQDRGPPAAKRLGDRVERRLVDVLKRSGAIEPIGKRLKRAQFVGFGVIEHARRDTGAFRAA